MDRSKYLDGLQLKDNLVFNDHVNSVPLINPQFIVLHWQENLCPDMEISLRELVREKLLICRLKESWPDCCVNDIRCINNEFRNLILCHVPPRASSFAPLYLSGGSA